VPGLSLASTLSLNKGLVSVAKIKTEIDEFHASVLPQGEAHAITRPLIQRLLLSVTENARRCIVAYVVVMKLKRQKADSSRLFCGKDIQTARIVGRLFINAINHLSMTD
jgi:hypothetical protein